ncbi:hypothetical protein [Qipengyuania sp.]|uniref:hypothetical protein n=1 Tax=Qipengyuania sp. TaxID=2004515 RepID=UPI003AF7B9BC
MTEAGKKPAAPDGAPERSPAPLYVNHLQLDASLAEIRLGFGQIPDDGEGLRPAAELVTSPSHFDRFRQQIEDCWGRYRLEFGGAGARDGRGRRS